MLDRDRTRQLARMEKLRKRGMTVAEAAKAEGLSAVTYYTWKAGSTIRARAAHARSGRVRKLTAVPEVAASPLDATVLTEFVNALTAFFTSQKDDDGPTWSATFAAGWAAHANRKGGK